MDENNYITLEEYDKRITVFNKKIEAFEKEIYNIKHIFLNTKFNSTLFGKIQDLTRDIIPREKRIGELEKRLSDVEPNSANHILYEQWCDKLTGYFNRLETLEKSKDFNTSMEIITTYEKLEKRINNHYQKIENLEAEFIDGIVACNNEDIGVNRKWIKELEEKIENCITFPELEGNLEAFSETVHTMEQKIDRNSKQLEFLQRKQYDPTLRFKLPDSWLKDEEEQGEHSKGKRRLVAPIDVQKRIEQEEQVAAPTEKLWDNIKKLSQYNKKEATNLGGILGCCKNYDKDFIMCQNQECGKCFSFESKDIDEILEDLNKFDISESFSEGVLLKELKEKWKAKRNV